MRKYLEIEMIVTDLIETLTIEQLLKRLGWEYCTPQNILELANKGAFGLYVHIKHKRKSRHCINRCIASLINSELESDAEKKDYTQLKKKLISFCKNYPHLLKKKYSYERLETFDEVEIFEACKNSSVQLLLEDGKIPFLDYNNTFGFHEIKEEIFSNSYFLLYLNPYFSPPKIYKGFYSIDDVIVFIDQINQFEKEKKIIQNDINTALELPIEKKPKRKQIRIRAHHEAIKSVYDKIDNKVPVTIWVELKKLKPEPIIGVDNWSSYNAKIIYRDDMGNTKTISKRTFQNLISKLKK